MATANIGTTIRIDQPNGSYIGEVSYTNGHTIYLRNYSAWDHKDPAPYNSPYYDDEVSIRLTAESVMDVFE